MSVYRDSSDGARAHLRELLCARELEAAGMSADFARVFGRRVGRVAFGGVLTAAGLALFGALLVRWSGAALLGSGPMWQPGSLTLLLIASWPIAIGAWALARAAAPSMYRRRLAAALALRGDLFASLEQARNVTVADAARHVVDRLERRSAALPLIGVSLLLPLTSHLIVAAALNGPYLSMAGFDSWIALSALLVGHCHVVLAGFGWYHARRLRDPSDRAVIDALNGGWSAWTWTVTASTIPGLVFFGIPVFLVAVTGLFIPILFNSVTQRVWTERAALGA